MAKGDKKKPSGKGKPQKKGVSSKRPAAFRLAVALLIGVISVLLLLTLVHQSRINHWFAPVADSSAPPAKEKVKTPAAPEKKGRSAVKAQPSRRSEAPTPPREAQQTGARPLPATTTRRHHEEYQEVPRKSVSHPSVSATVPSSSKHRPAGAVAAIIVDDLGADLEFMRSLLALDLNVTAAVMPNVPHAREVARMAQQAGREVILHIPMEPKDYPAADPGSEPLFVNLPKREVQRRLARYLNAVPFAVGGNNHMGSRFTEDREGMGAVLETLKERGLYFVDSRTTSDTVAYGEALRLGIKAAERDLFLDNVQTVAAISEEIRRLAELAQVHGRAIGICHPHPETLVALKQEAPYLAKLGVKLVPASRLTQ